MKPPQQMTILDIMGELKTGVIRIPDFQRDIVWDANQVESLLDSIFKGYPLGSFLLWKTMTSLKERNPLGLSQLGQTAEKKYLLDGQQRAVAIYLVFVGRIELGTGRKKTEYKAYFDLKNAVFNLYRSRDIQKGKVTPSPDQHELRQLIEIDLEKPSVDYPIQFYRNLLRDNKERQADSLDKLKQALKDPVVSAITVEGAGLDTACEIFVRLNKEGTPLSVVDLMVAKTYSDSPRFNLRESLDELNSELEPSFGLSKLTILECISACLSGGISEKDILASSDDLRSSWKKTTESLKRAIDFLQRRKLVPVSRFLPFDVLLAPLTFFHFKFDRASQTHLDQLEKFFWRACVSQRYIEGQNSKIKADIESVDHIGSGEMAPEFTVSLTSEQIREQELRMTSSVSKTVLCLYSTLRPRDLRDSEEVSIRDCFAGADASQIHHIFPKDYLRTLSKRKGYDSEVKPFINSIANTCLVTTLSNQIVGNRSPSKYLADLKNPKIELALGSHLIRDRSYEALMRDSFKAFLKHRSEDIVQILKNKCQ